MKHARPLWRWRVSVVNFVTAAENTENTSLSINYYDVKGLLHPKMKILS